MLIPNPDTIHTSPSIAFLLFFIRFILFLNNNDYTAPSLVKILTELIMANKEKFNFLKSIFTPHQVLLAAMLQV
jgi:hypothetical protein